MYIISTIPCEVHREKCTCRIKIPNAPIKEEVTVHAWSTAFLDGTPANEFWTSKLSEEEVKMSSWTRSSLEADSISRLSLSSGCIFLPSRILTNLFKLFFCFWPAKALTLALYPWTKRWTQNQEQTYEREPETVMFVRTIGQYSTILHRESLTHCCTVQSYSVHQIKYDGNLRLTRHKLMENFTKLRWPHISFFLPDQNLNILPVRLQTKTYNEQWILSSK